MGCQNPFFFRLSGSEFFSGHAVMEIFGSAPYKVDVGDTDLLNIADWDRGVHSHLVLEARLTTPGIFETF